MESLQTTSSTNHLEGALVDTVMESLQSRPTLWVSANPLIGRLGNQLFVAASSYGIAKQRGAEWCLQSTGILDTALDWTEKPMPCPTNVDQFTALTEMGKHASFVPTLLEDSLGSNVSVGLYLQSFKYFKGIPFSLKAEAWGKQWVSQRGINAGIHIRRGDFLTDEYHMDLLPPLEYYAAAIYHLKNMAKNERLTFFVASEDLAWVRSQSLFDGMVVTEDHRTPEEDMSILAACQHMILSAGTFSWWSAYLSEHKNMESFKIYYSEPTKEWHSGSRVPTDHYPSNWIGIDQDNVRRIIDGSRGLNYA
jgi:hypothetical protein